MQRSGPEGGCQGSVRTEPPASASGVPTGWPAAEGPLPGGQQDLGPSRTQGPLEPLHARLSRLVRLTADETYAVDSLPHRQRSLRSEETMVREGDDHDHVYLILQGFAYRYKLLANGHRQILGFLLPGDLCDLDFADGHPADHSVSALNDGVVAMISTARINDLRAVHPNIHSALLLVAMAERSILRHWLLNVGQRNAVERITHLLCELAVRLRAVGHHNRDGSLDVPLSQTALADTTGMTTVHVNRTLQRLRKDGLIELHRNRLTILDPQRLANNAGFNGDYLQHGRYRD